jgi:hypothetical protein
VIEMPARIARLPRQAGYPVPWFVAWIDGVADFRVIGPGKITRAVKERRCWVCGDVMGRHLAFPIGPMCAINRVSSEPPSHKGCAEYSVKACPFLTTPAMVRRVTKIPDGTEDSAGIGIPRNPGVMVIWNTESYRIDRVGDVKGANDGVLFRVGPPTELSWWREGRMATRAEIMDSIESGLPILRGMAEKQGPEAEKALQEQYVAALELLPA